MNAETFAQLFTEENLQKLFPKERADQFFDALFGDASEGAYDISLAYDGMADGQLKMGLVLSQRPGHCLACNLTYGLPQVFARHPVINIQGLVKSIEEMGAGSFRCADWSFGTTVQKTRTTHIIPLSIQIAPK